MSKKIVSLTLDKGLIKKIDERRGMIPRSAFIQKILVDYLG